jgi:hypothetical protein
MAKATVIAIALAKGQGPSAFVHEHLLPQLTKGGQEKDHK